MPSCVAYGCTNRSDYSLKSKGITFHSFPSNPTGKALWVKAVRRKDWIPTKRSIICSQHFREEDIDRTSLVTVRIRENAVPSIFTAYPSHLQKKEKKRPPPSRRQKVTENPVDLPSTCGTPCEVSSLATDTLPQCSDEKPDVSYHQSA